MSSSYGCHSRTDLNASSLVFVHGLNPLNNQNHAFDTWTHENGVFWPADLLGEDLPHARIWVYGYNSQVAYEAEEARIKDHANVLLDRLQRQRRNASQSDSLPIIFIGHSLGGLVIKQALLNARDNRSYSSILEATYGLIFFGCPHRGSRGNAPGQIAADVARFLSQDKARNDLLDCLKKNSLFTQEATERFRHQLERYNVISFYETRPMLVPKGVFKRALSGIVVDKDSAVLNLSGDRELQLSLNADHSSICKVARI
jgi:pimeloyl-ACP methyl ester carboxylesterase